MAPGWIAANANALKFRDLTTRRRWYNFGMKIILIGPVYPYRGGIAYVTTHLANTLMAAGHQIKVISFSRQYPGFLYPGKNDKDPSQQPIKIPADYLLDPLYPWTWFNTSKAAAEFQPDLIILTWWTTFWAPAYFALCKLLGKRARIALLIHNAIPHEARFYDRWLTKLVFRRADHYIVLSQRESRRLTEIIPDAAPYLCDLPLHDISQTRLSKSEARAALNLPQVKHVLLFFGIVRPYKGLNILLEALAILKQRGKSPYLLIAGEFWEDIKDYEAKIHSLGLLDLVRIDNRYIPNEEVGVFFSAADLFVAPYLDGTQSGAISVAMSQNVPILATDRIAGDLAWVSKVPAGDAEALANGIINCLEELETPSQFQSQTDNSWSGITELLNGIRKTS